MTLSFTADFVPRILLDLRHAVKNPRHRAVWFATLLAGALGALALGWWLTREPRHQGRSLSQWLEALDNPSTATNLETRMALHQMADRAAVRLVPMLEASDSSLTLKLVALARKQPFIAVRFVPASVKHQRAEAAFEIMADRAMAAAPALVSLLVRRGAGPPEYLDDPAGSAGRALVCIGPRAIPHLRRALVSEQARVRQEAIGVLLCFAYDREPGGIAELVKALDDPEPKVRAGVAIVLGKLHRQAGFVVPHLTRLMADPNPGVRRQAAFALGRFGPKARDGITALQRACSDTEAKVRQAAGLALTQIEANGATAKDPVESDSLPVE